MYQNPGGTHRSAFKRLADLPDESKTLERKPQAVSVDRMKLRNFEPQTKKEDNEKHGG